MHIVQGGADMDTAGPDLTEEEEISEEDALRAFSRSGYAPSKLQVVDLKPIAAERNSQCVQVLEEFLERAVKGEFTSMMIVADIVGPGKELAHAWTGCDNLFEMVGKIERLKQVTLHRMGD